MMNRAERRHPSKASKIRGIMEDLSAINKIQEAMAEDWPFKAGDKVKLDLEKIKSDKGYDQRLPAYKKFCEENADRVFTVDCVDGVGPNLVCLVEDDIYPRWLFWMGHLKPV